MSEQETIAVAEVSDGRASVGEPGTEVALPVVELLTGRGFVTGKSGSGKSNTASVVVENLLDLGFPVLIVDIDGEYYGLKEKYEILHVGADEECDIQVSEEHAEKVADLALHQNVPIILDVSSFLDESEAADLLTEVARHLFAKEKKLKKPFLLVVEEIHEYLPEGGGLDECGRMLIKVGKRGRKHGLGVCGISQRPADVKKDFITQCDWLCWHRLTWRNDTKVVKRVLGSEYADAVEGLGDGEAFLVTDWSEDVRRVQFHRKQTFDAGATPGLEDFERPDLKSVSDDLVNELSSITEEEQQRQDRIDELRAELRKKESRIETLEKDLENARDLRHLADQFAAALFDHPGRSRMQMRRERLDAEQQTLEETAGDGTADRREDDDSEQFPAEDAWSPAEDAALAGTDEEASGQSERTDADSDPATPRTSQRAADSADSAGSTNGTDGTEGAERAEAASAAATRGATDGDTASNGSSAGQSAQSFGDAFADSAPWPDWGADDADDADDAEDVPGSGVLVSGGRSSGASGGSGGPETDREDGSVHASGGVDRMSTATDDDSSPEAGESGGEEPAPHERSVVRQVRRVLESSDAVTLGMLMRYRRRGPLAPEDAHVAAGGDGDRTKAYSRNSTLRQAGLVRHAGRGRYDYALRDLVERTHDDRLSPGEVDAVVERIEEELLVGPLEA